MHSKFHALESSRNAPPLQSVEKLSSTKSAPDAKRVGDHGCAGGSLQTVLSIASLVKVKLDPVKTRVPWSLVSIFREHLCDIVMYIDIWSSLLIVGFFFVCLLLCFFWSQVPEIALK